MGTDIHLMVEVQYNGKWFPEFKEKLSVGRNYDLFDRLAGVRCRHEVECAVEYKGWPEGVNPVTREELEDYYGISWISIEDALEVPKELAGDWYHLMRYLRRLSWTIDGIRIVFGFDS